MKTSNLLKWTNNKNSGKNGNRMWIHPPESLTQGHAAYLVKFLGETEVQQPKGLDVVKEAMRKLRFNHQIKKAEGQKSRKVEITVSIDGVAVQDPKTKKIMYQYPLHRISYCTDDKTERKFFSFIAKEADSDVHICFVFVSDKLAEEITLTIGQAFDLAYKRFLEGTGRDIEVKRQVASLQVRIQSLEHEKVELSKRLKELSNLVGINRLQEYLNQLSIPDILYVEPLVVAETPPLPGSQPESPEPAAGILEGELIAISAVFTPEEEKIMDLPPVPPRNGLRQEDASHSLFTDLEPKHSDFAFGLSAVSPRTENGAQISPGSGPVPLAPPPTKSSRGGGSPPLKDPFGTDPFAAPPFVKPIDIFGMDAFSSQATNLLQPQKHLASKDFSLDSLDPLKA